MLAGFLVGLGTIGGLALPLVLTPQYAARTLLQYQVSTDDAGDTYRTGADFATQVALLTSPAVLGPVATANNVAMDDLTRRVSVTVLSANSVDSELLQVDVTNPDRATGVTLADAIAKQYLVVTRATGTAAVIQGQLNDARRQLATASAATQPALQIRVATLQGQLDTVHMTGEQASVATPAFSVTAPVSPQRLLTTAAGLLAGLVLAVLLLTPLARRWTRA
ncbi:MAG TPA: hypothetical protein VH008_25835 [Pseudonocardia sp.]|nr:hypothetical protein [Pseudonocardia sp.]